MRVLTLAKAAQSLYIGRITAVEVYAAITGRQRGGSLSTAQAGAMLGHFRRHLAQRYHVLELSPALFTDAMLAARKHGLRAYDALQLTAAPEMTRRGYGSEASRARPEGIAQSRRKWCTSVDFLPINGSNPRSWDLLGR